MARHSLANTRTPVALCRPFPPSECADDEPVGFWVADDLVEWILATFVRADGSLANEDHAHLVDAYIGAVWTNAINQRQQRTVMATAEMPSIQAGGWRRARFEHQMAQWFGRTPDFLLTFSGPLCRALSDREFCALVEHELYHCAPALDAFGQPRFRDDGSPLFAMRGHDVEEFVAVVERYGPTSFDVRRLVKAASNRPEIDEQPIQLACGTCLRAA